ncbi:MAG TPA: alpha/beta hydrolase [Verrucomicrobiae bacterium]|nr:alpha/beta hydrolase [Verrucomicrobiae bacterium]
MEEGDGVKDPPAGQRRCIVVVPKEFAPSNPWSWRGCYWNHQPQTEIELLKRGFCIAYISAGQDLRPDKNWDVWYDFLVQRGLSPKPAFIGMSRGGEFAYTWATSHPDKVSCIYADNPGGNMEALMRLGALATNDVPLLHVCGSIDPLLGKYSTAIENIYQQFGGRISVMIKEGRGHHPHSLNEPKPIADFIEQSVNEVKTAVPDYVGDKFTKGYYYSAGNSYRYFPSEQNYLTCRGPLFTNCYARYEFELPGVESFSKIIVPENPAPGNPWVFRADLPGRDDAVDQALLAKGFYIVTGAVPYNADGPTLEQWNLIYKHFVEHGFSQKLVMEGNGGAAGAAYVWAIANPDKVSCIYTVNADMHSYIAKTQPLDNLAPLAKAGVPIFHICGSRDPWLEDNTMILQKRYTELGGKIEVLIQKDEGHFLTPQNPAAVVDFILKATAQRN